MRQVSGAAVNAKNHCITSKIKRLQTFDFHRIYLQSSGSFLGRIFFYYSPLFTTAWPPNSFLSAATTLPWNVSSSSER
jgi:hypothetical protein